MTRKKFSRGIEKIIALAALDAEFRAALLENRETTIDSSNIRITGAERKLILSIPDDQLADSINRVKVTKEARRKFLTGAIGAAIALVLGTCVMLPAISSTGIRAPYAVARTYLQSLYMAQREYMDENKRYARTLKELADLQLIDDSLASGRSVEYIFLLSNVTDESYEIRALPSNKNMRFFFMTQTGTIRYSDGPEVGPESRKLGE